MQNINLFRQFAQVPCISSCNWSEAIHSKWLFHEHFRDEWNNHSNMWPMRCDATRHSARAVGNGSHFVYIAVRIYSVNLELNNCFEFSGQGNLICCLQMCNEDRAWNGNFLPNKLKLILKSNDMIYDFWRFNKLHSVSQSVQQCDPLFSNAKQSISII